MEKKTIALIVIVAAIVGAIAWISHLTASPQSSLAPVQIPVAAAQQPEQAQADGTPASPAQAQLSAAAAQRIAGKQGKYPRAIELAHPSGFVNAAPFNLSDEIGKKVILVDFWTYSCINCERTLPYLTAWDDKYRDQGLLIVGVHTPEFEFEKDYGNVVRATQKFGVKYPVVLDNDRATWQAYNNHYWPHEYLIDIDGFVVHDHIGEGGYDETEKAIQGLLEERREALGLNMTVGANLTRPTQAPQFGQITSEETYLGYGFSRDQLGNAQGYRNDQEVAYEAPAALEDGKFYLDGTWRDNRDNAQAVRDSRVLLRYGAKDVYAVAGSKSPAQVQVVVDGVAQGNVTVSDQTLYTLVNGTSYGTHTLELKVAPGVELYTFTFG